MKTILRYQANDGAIFDSAEACTRYEDLCAEVTAIMAQLISLPLSERCHFGNGGGYIQQDPETFKKVRRSLLKLAQRECPHKWIDQSIADDSIDPSWAGRIISDCSAPISRGWYRISCTDKRFREWGQPYFALNPSKGKQEEYRG